VSHRSAGSAVITKYRLHHCRLSGITTVTVYLVFVSFGWYICLYALFLHFAGKALFLIFFPGYGYAIRIAREREEE